MINFTVQWRTFADCFSARNFFVRAFFDGLLWKRLFLFRKIGSSNRGNSIALRCITVLCSLLKLCWYSHRCNEQFRTHSTHTQIGFVQNETATRCTNSNASKNCLSYTSNLMLISSHEELPLRNNQTILSEQRGKQKCNLRKFDNYIVFCVELQHLHFDEIFSIIQKKFDEFDDSLSCKHKDAGTNTIFSP